MPFTIQENLYNYTPSEKFRVLCPYEFDLQGVNTIVPLYIPKSMPVLWNNTTTNVILVWQKLFIIYTEASSADTAITNGVRIGVPSNNSYYHDLTTATSQAQWSVTEISAADFTAEDRVFNDGNHEVILIRSIGGKAGTGKIMVGAEFSRNYSERLQA